MLLDNVKKCTIENARPYVSLEISSYGNVVRMTLMQRYSDTIRTLMTRQRESCKYFHQDIALRNMNKDTYIKADIKIKVLNKSKSEIVNKIMNFI